MSLPSETVGLKSSYPTIGKRTVLLGSSGDPNKLFHAMIDSGHIAIMERDVYKPAKQRGYLELTEPSPFYTISKGIKKQISGPDLLQRCLALDNMLPKIKDIEEKKYFKRNIAHFQEFLAPFIGQIANTLTDNDLKHQYFETCATIGSTAAQHYLELFNDSDPAKQALELSFLADPTKHGEKDSLLFSLGAFFADNKLENNKFITGVESDPGPWLIYALDRAVLPIEKMLYGVDSKSVITIRESSLPMYLFTYTNTLAVLSYRLKKTSDWPQVFGELHQRITNVIRKARNLQYDLDINSKLVDLEARLRGLNQKESSQGIKQYNKRRILEQKKKENSETDKQETLNKISGLIQIKGDLDIGATRRIEVSSASRIDVHLEDVLEKFSIGEAKSALNILAAQAEEQGMFFLAGRIRYQLAHRYMDHVNQRGPESSYLPEMIEEYMLSIEDHKKAVDDFIDFRQQQIDQKLLDPKEGKLHKSETIDVINRYTGNLCYEFAEFLSTSDLTHLDHFPNPLNYYNEAVCRLENTHAFTAGQEETVSRVVEIRSLLNKFRKNKNILKIAKPSQQQGFISKFLSWFT